MHGREAGRDAIRVENVPSFSITSNAIDGDSVWLFEGKGALGDGVAVHNPGISSATATYTIANNTISEIDGLPIREIWND
jgi:hypothetical protein